jgi:hypothetical protein
MHLLASQLQATPVSIEPPRESADQEPCHDLNAPAGARKETTSPDDTSFARLADSAREAFEFPANDDRRVWLAPETE